MESNVNSRDLEAIYREITDIKTDVKEIREGLGDRLTRVERDGIYVRGILAAIAFILGVPSLVGSGLGAVWFLKLITGH